MSHEVQEHVLSECTIKHFSDIIPDLPILGGRSVFWLGYLENIKDRKCVEVGFSLLRTDRYPPNNQPLIPKFDIVFKAFFHVRNKSDLQ